MNDLSNLKQLKFLVRVSRMAHYKCLGDMLMLDLALFNRAARHWRRRHPI